MAAASLSEAEMQAFELIRQALGLYQLVDIGSRVAGSCSWKMKQNSKKWNS